jgi:hypothetical protein
MHRKLLQYALPLAFFLVLASAPARAGLAEGAQATMTEALDRFGALLKDDAAKSSPPRLADPKAKPAFDALFDRGKILGEHPYKAADIEPLLWIFSGYFNLSKVYLGFQDPAGTASTADNEFAYQDELSRLAVEMIVSGGAISQALTDYVETAPGGTVPEDRKAGLAKMRIGVSQMFSGVIALLENPRYEKENKIALADALAEAGPYLAAILPPADRKNFSQTAMQSMLNTPPETVDPINAFMNSMSGEDCTALCALK